MKRALRDSDDDCRCQGCAHKQGKNRVLYIFVYIYRSKY